MKGFNPKNKEKLNSLKYQICRILLAKKIGMFEENAVTIFSTEIKNRRVLLDALKQIESDGLMQGTKCTLSKSEDGILILVFLESVDCPAPQKVPLVSVERFCEEFML